MKTSVLIFNNFFPENRAVYEIMSKQDVMIWRTRVECWMSKATRTHSQAHSLAPGHQRARTRTHTHTHTHTQANILIAFRLQRWFRQRASILRYM